MTDDSLKKKVLSNEKNIKDLVGRNNKFNNKLRKLTEEIKHLERENQNLKREIIYLRGKG